MNEPSESNESNAADRRRAYRITARLLREYTARINRLGDLFGTSLEGHSPTEIGGAVHSPNSRPNGRPSRSLPWAVMRALNRYEAIRKQFRSLTLFASQMLVHYDLEPAEACELRLRLADAENADEAARWSAITVVKEYGVKIDLATISADPAA